LAEHKEAFVSVEGDLVVPVETSAVVYPGVGAFDHRASWLEDETVAGFWPGHDVDSDAGDIDPTRCGPRRVSR